MSKSDENANSYISMLETPEIILSKVKKSVTDSRGIIAYSDEQPGLKNLLNIYSSFTGQSTDEIVKSYEGKGYGDLKKDTAEVISEGLRPVREKYDYLMKNKDYLEDIYSAGAKKAAQKAMKTLDKVYRKVGFVAKPRF